MIGLAMLLLAGAAQAQAQAPAPPAVRGSDLTVSVVTMGPGTLVWERFGHNAIRVTDARTGSDITYNYGMFSFEQENFLLRFIQGRMLYWMAGHDAEREMAHYVEANRSVWVQELNLSPEQKVAMRDFLEWNAQDENKFYRYDYYLDNCSTRVRDALDLILGGVIRAATGESPANATFRSHTRRLTENDVLVYTGLQLGLGSPTDRPITEWEEMFLPLALREHLRTVSIPTAGGGTRPLVKSERTIYESTAPAPPASPPTWWPFFLGAGLLIGSALVLMGSRLHESVAARFGFAVIGGIWSLVAGIAGLLLAGLWGLTDHAAAYANYNLLQLSPLSLPLAVLLPRLALRSGRPVGLLTLFLAVVVAALAIFGLGIRLAPGVSQANAEIMAFALPVQVAIGIAVWRRK